MFPSSRSLETRDAIEEERRLFCDVKEPTFFFNGIARFKRTRAWKHSVGQPDHEYGVKFQAFRLMHRRKVNGFLVRRRIRRRFGIDVANQGQLREKLLGVGELAGEGRQLI